jgi:CubicO group peptidase (beta-lactamase class C family)
MVRPLKWLVGATLLLALLVLAFLLATGERGLLESSGSGRPLSPFEPRPVATARLDAEETARLGWRPQGLDAVLTYASQLSADTLIIRTGGRDVATLGRTDLPHDIHSARKAVLSAVVGQRLGSGPAQIPLDATLAELGVDDAPNPLTPLQRQATVLDLLRSKSGINHAAAADGGLTADKDRRLGQDENRPGTVWAYNNWDYNALTTIFERRTGKSVAEAFADDLARPLGMQDVTADSAYVLERPALSRHRAAMFRLSGRDLARFGQLYLDKGTAEGRPLLPASWVARITHDYAETGIGGLRAGHGYLWWLPSAETGLPEGSFFAWGLGQQSVFVIPAWDTVIVHQSDTAAFLERWLALQRQGVGGEPALEQLVMDCFDADTRETEFCREHRFTTRREFDTLIALIVEARRAD